MAKYLLVTKSFPPVIGGSAYLLYEITRHFSTDEMVVVHGVNDPPIESYQALPFKRKQVLFLGSGINTLRFNRYLPKYYLKMIRIVIRQMIKRENPKCIYIHFPNGAFAVAAYLEAKKAKLPYLFYQDILWEEKEKGAELKLAKEFENILVKDASYCVAITEFAAEHQSLKHKREFITIPHTLDSTNIPSRISEVSNQIPRIHFAGGIYPQMNLDSVIRLIEASKRLHLKLEFEFCSPDIPPILQNDQIEWKYLTKDELIKAQRSCDLLFLPQAFESHSQTMIKHNFPTKTMEYLCSGRPILVHSPSDSYLSDLCRKENFGYLVDNPNVQELSVALEQLLTNKDLQNQVVSNAIKFAHKRDSVFWYKELKGLLDDIAIK